jgi:glycosyltransferase involved in cell wall biosynthesis
MKFSVIICTYNRGDSLKKTLASLAKLSTNATWELIVVDNNSTDNTRNIVEEASKTFPVDLRYLFEPEPGKSAAQNTGIRDARGEIIATIDDDAVIGPYWLDRAAEGLERFNCDFVGGRVVPVWGGPRPKWLQDKPGLHWAVIALQDLGPQPVEYGVNGVPWPLGVNEATRRDAFTRTGLFDNRLGPIAGTLRNQANREWHLRARAVGVRGFYIPEMVVHHVVPAARLKKKYFRRWLYWHGISRAIIYEKLGVDMESPDDSQLDYSKVPHIAGVPRYLYRNALAALPNMIRETIRRDPVASFEHELKLWFYAGVFKQRWTNRRVGPHVGLSSVLQVDDRS